MVRIVEPSAEIVSDINGTEILKHIELCARNCYKSESLISEDCSSAKQMITKLMDLNHLAMIEHFSFTVRLVCDVGVYKDLTRHRVASFAIESTRYCNYSKDKFSNEITVIEPCNIPKYKEGSKTLTEEYSLWLETMKTIEQNYMKMSDLGCKPDQLRMLLPHSTAASVIITCNLREWRHIFNLRCDRAAHPSVQQVMKMLLEKVHQEIPVFFDDLYDKYIKGEKNGN